MNKSKEINKQGHASAIHKHLRIIDIDNQATDELKKSVPKSGGRELHEHLYHILYFPKSADYLDDKAQ
jgi:hypothetical protein